MKVLLTVTLLFPVISIAKGFEDYIEFSPVNYTVTSREISRSGKLIETDLPEKCSIVSLKASRDGFDYDLYIVKFDSLIDLTGFWYRFISDYSTNLKSATSALPLIYGKIDITYKEKIYACWFTGIEQIMFLVVGTDKPSIDDLRYKLSNYR
ncbi:MAG TPA: hypothetical protein PLI39_04700 [Petrotogaceae bacterium]|nr:hypothetical protein [Petrotogaceae bacterium]